MVSENERGPEEPTVIDQAIRAGDEAVAKKVVEHFVFVKAECGCRFQIVSALPVLNAGVLAMPDIAANVCDDHRKRQEEALEKQKEDAQRTEIVGPDGRTVVRTRDG